MVETDPGKPSKASLTETYDYYDYHSIYIDDDNLVRRWAMVHLIKSFLVADLMLVVTENVSCLIRRGALRLIRKF